MEVGLSEHGRLPGEWYGVCKINEIFAALNESYNFDEKLFGNFLGGFKICEFKNGEIITKEVLSKGIGRENFNYLLQKSDQNSEKSGH